MCQLLIQDELTLCNHPTQENYQGGIQGGCVPVDQPGLSGAASLSDGASFLSPSHHPPLEQSSFLLPQVFLNFYSSTTTQSCWPTCVNKNHRSSKTNLQLHPFSHLNPLHKHKMHSTALIVLAISVLSALAFGSPVEVQADSQNFVKRSASFSHPTDLVTNPSDLA